jgi:hypothetical protein
LTAGQWPKLRRQLRPYIIHIIDTFCADERELVPLKRSVQRHANPGGR